MHFTQDLRSKICNTQRLATHWLNSIEILIYFIFNTIECDRSTWLARWKVDRSTPQSVWTLSVDQPLFQALDHAGMPKWYEFSKFSLCDLILKLPLLIYFLSGWQLGGITELHCLCALNPQSIIKWNISDKKIVEP